MKNFFAKILSFIKGARKALIAVGGLLAATLLCLGLADGVQKDWGNVTVTSGQIEATTVENEQYSMGGRES